MDTYNKNPGMHIEEISIFEDAERLVTKRVRVQNSWLSRIFFSGPTSEVTATVTERYKRDTGRKEYRLVVNQEAV
ncbi:MAG: hypothetical protein LBU04_01915 [Christensenellaceae bacterium]|jgi:hypothetical protein|nr:hypothetical protein [Christensenellaceae bacterium]